MAREKPLFRNNLDRLDEAFPNREVLKYKDIADITGLSLRTVRLSISRRVPISSIRPS